MTDDEIGDFVTPALLEALVEDRKGVPGSGEKLKEYWTKGEGAAKIRWGTPGDFDRCVRHLAKYIADPKGYCSDMHQRATGFRPGHAPSEQREGTPMTATESEPVDVQRPIEIRSSTTEVADVNVKERVITVVAVPYEQPAKIGYRGEMWDEVFSRTAFDGIEKRPQRVRVNREHRRGDTVGKAIAFYPDRTEGLVADLRIAKTLRGDETLALAEDDCLSCSIGFGVRPSDQVLDRRAMTRRINKAWCDHLGLVEDPAYEGADVLDVRDALGAYSDNSERLLTPVLDDFMADPIVRRALGL
jgi:phage head maturation protease